MEEVLLFLVHVHLPRGRVERLRVPNVPVDALLADVARMAFAIVGVTVLPRYTLHYGEYLSQPTETGRARFSANAVLVIKCVEAPVAPRIVRVTSPSVGALPAVHGDAAAASPPHPSGVDFYPLQNYSRSPFNFQYAPSRASSTTSITGDSSVSLLASSQA